MNDREKLKLLIEDSPIQMEDKIHWSELVQGYSDPMIKSFVWLFEHSPYLLIWLTNYSKERQIMLKDAIKEKWDDFFSRQKELLSKILQES